MNNRDTAEISFLHPVQSVSFSHIENGDIYIYYFIIEDGKIKLHSIDKLAKCGKSGNNFKKEELFHHEYKKTITNYETGEFEKPIVPDYILKYAQIHFLGYILQNSIR